jgi:hypothetical protein
MARTIRVGDIGDYANSQMEKLLRSAVLETDALLKSASPVDLPAGSALSWASRRECSTIPRSCRLAIIAGNAAGQLHHVPPMGKIHDQDERVGQRLQQSTTTCHMQKSLLLAPLDQVSMNKKSDLTQLVR